MPSVVVDKELMLGRYSLSEVANHVRLPMLGRIKMLLASRILNDEVTIKKYIKNLHGEP